MVLNPCLQLPFSVIVAGVLDVSITVSVGNDGARRPESPGEFRIGISAPREVVGMRTMYSGGNAGRLVRKQSVSSTY